MLLNSSKRLRVDLNFSYARNSSEFLLKFFQVIVHYHIVKDLRVTITLQCKRDNFPNATRDSVYPSIETISETINETITLQTLGTRKISVYHKFPMIKSYYFTITFGERRETHLTICKEMNCNARELDFFP